MGIYSSLGVYRLLFIDGACFHGGVPSCFMMDGAVFVLTMEVGDKVFFNFNFLGDNSFCSILVLLGFLLDWVAR